VPVVEKISRELVSQDLKNNTSNTKITHALIIPKINKDDLFLLCPKFRKDLGNCCPLLLCIRVTSQLYFLDLTSNRKLVITPSQFASYEPFSDIFSFKHYGRNYTVLDNEGIRNEESHNTVATYGLVVTPED
jgi:NMD protein affecting ribosome stability and mRNA decay